MADPWDDNPNISKLHFERMLFDLTRPPGLALSTDHIHVDERQSDPDSEMSATSLPARGAPASQASGIQRWIGILAVFALIGSTSLYVFDKSGANGNRKDFPSQPVEVSNRAILKAKAEAETTQGQQAKAEQSWRSLLGLQQNDLEPEQNEIVRTQLELSLCLETQGKKAEALIFAIRAANGFQAIYGEGHEDTLMARKTVERLSR